MNRTYRQQVVDEYLEATGREMYIPAEFLRWLEPQHNHRAWAVFFSKSDEEAAHEHRLQLARHFASGLRISVTTTEVERRVIRGVVVERPVVIQVPAFISPRAGRRSGGGYTIIDPDIPESMAELFGQAGDALGSWLARYGGTAKLAGADVSTITRLIEILWRAAGQPDERAAG